jgi:hyperosmotically inducible protein
MRKLFLLMTITLVTVTLGVAKQREPHNDVFTPGPANESQLARNIRHELLMLPYYSVFDDLAFQLNGSVVTLEGACPPEPPWNIRSDAENVVKRIPGVTRVINEIKLLPLSSMDWQVRRAEARAIYGDPEIGMRYGYQALPSIHIIVDNGKVTLEGVVDNQFDDTLVRTRAQEVPNVFSVTDNLVVLNRPRAK